MQDSRKKHEREPVELEDLELDKDALKELHEEDSELAKGGLLRGTGGVRGSTRCPNTCNIGNPSDRYAAAHC